MTKASVSRLLCCCCGASTRGRQWWNQDTGYGLCAECGDWIPSRPGHQMTPEDMERTYGTRGVHYAIEEAPSLDAEPPPNARDMQGQILADRSSSFWLQDAVKAAEQRDCLDALRDAESLLIYCKLRAKEAGL